MAKKIEILQTIIDHVSKCEDDEIECPECILGDKTFMLDYDLSSMVVDETGTSMAPVSNIQMLFNSCDTLMKILKDIGEDSNAKT